MNFQYPFSLPREEARERLHALSDYLSNRHGIHAVWNGDSASIKGRYLVVSFEATMTLGDGAVQVIGKDPGLLWRKKAVKYLTGKFDKYLDKNTPVDSLPRGK